jgi:Zn-dependent protease
MARWWVMDLWQDSPLVLFSWVVWVIGSIVLHELAHGWAAIASGDRTPIETGHMTWNPVVHMGVPSLVMFALVGIAWGMMPVNPARMRGKYADVRVSLAGPMMNIWLAVVACAAAAVTARYSGLVLGDEARANLFVFFALGGTLNFALAIFNLLPVPPLDGSRILAGMWRSYAEAMMTERTASVSMVVFILLFLFGGEYVFKFGMEATTRGFGWVVGWLP